MIGVPLHAITCCIVSYFSRALQRWNRRRVAQLESLIVIIVAAIAVYIVFKILTGIIRFVISLAIVGVVIFLLLQFLS
jgi:hypothetical protein